MSFHHRLFPLTPAELEAVGLTRDLERFLLRGGFPEPWLAEDEAEAGRWRRLHLNGLIREDILSFENITRLKDIPARTPPPPARPKRLYPIANSRANATGFLNNELKRPFRSCQSLWVRDAMQDASPWQRQVLLRSE
ncbi:hypothetical protein [Desulfonatronum thioautotrophicum]|uniref:hypothetical protein n=1 Tax=Desulfonatronum thioautotrophicum TaxID=617001 RepID=UPI001427D8F6|nr:hypothetical protein [Desulfonatronum thioautotrophicum]